MNKELIEGEIGRYVNHKLRGWCRASSSEEPRKIECLLDDKIIGEYLSNEPRKKLQKKAFNSINHGFTIDLHLSTKLNHKIEIRDSNTKQPLSNNPTLIRGSSEQPLVFFVHIPKTAGTSLRLMLDACFLEREVFPNMKDIRSNSGLYPDLNEIFSIKLDRLNKLKLINGHYPMLVADHWLMEINLVTFFRRPAERVISHLKHLKKNDKSCNGLSLEDIYSKHKNSLVNLQLRVLKNREYKTAHLINSKSSNFNETKLIKTLDRFSAFGIVEEFDRSIAWISDALNLDLGKKIFSNQASPEFTVSEELKSQIELDCKLENRAYECIKSEFYNRSAYLRTKV